MATEHGTAVVKQDARKMLDVQSAKVNAKFLDAYTTGRLDSLKGDEKTMFLFALGERLGVKPELGELMIYQGKPYITIDGRFRLAHESGLLVGVETRPATQMERRNFGAEDGEALWVCDVYRRGAARAFRGWGYVGKNDRNPVGKTHPRELAKKRAKYDALRTGFPPAEQVSSLHQEYIEAAEAETRKLLATTHPLASGEYSEIAETGADEVVHAEAGEVPQDDRDLDDDGGR